MITIETKSYDRKYPAWVTQCPLCNKEDLDAVIKLESDSLNHVHFAIGKNCRIELSKKLLNPDKI